MLNNTNSFKDKYIQFANQAIGKQYLPLQIQPAWLNLVCGNDQWDVCLSFDKEGTIVGVMPYFFQKKWGLMLIKMPPFTDYLGPCFFFKDDATMKKTRRYSLQKQVLTDIIAQLPSSTYFFYQCQVGLNDWLPFKWAGYQQTTYYTYEIDLFQPKEDIWSQLRRNTKRNIKAAEQNLMIEPSEEVNELFQLCADTARKQNRALGFTKSELEKLHQWLMLEKRGILLHAVDSEQSVQAALLLAWDNQKAYTLLSASGTNVLAPSLLNWYLLDYLPNELRYLDFCGSIIPDVEHATIGMGATRKPYYKIFRSSNLFWHILARLAKTEYA